MKYSIPECNIESLEKKLTRIRNKCAKYGCEFKYERVGEHFEKHMVEFEEGGKVKKSLVDIRFIDIEAEGKAIVNGWQFVASLDYTEKGNVITGVGNIEVPERYYSCAPWCEHCRTARDRKHSFIVYNVESEEFKQVGRACLKDFTGGLSAENVANYESFFKEIEDSCSYGGWGSWGKVYYKVEDFMATASEIFRLYGYVRRTDEGLCTADRVDFVYRVENALPLGLSRELAEDLYDDAVSKGYDRKNGMQPAREVIDWIVNNDRNDNYFHNMKVACSLEYCAGDKIGLLVSAFPSYNRDLEYQAEKREREAKEKEAAAKSSWMGNVGDKVSFEIADFRVISSWDTQWGTTGVFKFVSVDGREATWKTSNWVTDDCIGGVITGKVKELKEYRDIKQTELTRCKIEYPRKEEKAESHPAWDDSAMRAFVESMDVFEGGA